MKAIRIANDEFPENPGEFSWETDEQGEPTHIHAMLPLADGEKSFLLIPISRQHQPGRAWGWDGNLDHPTLTPSIRQRAGGQEIWHGYLRNGEWVSV